MNTDTLAQMTADAYLPSQGSFAEDLQSLGVRIENTGDADERMAAFLNGSGGVFDQVPATSYRALVDLFDRSWLGYAASAA